MKLYTRKKGDPFPVEPTESLDPARYRRFRRLVTGLNRLMEEIRQDWPEANYYLEEDTLIVLSGPSHEGVGEAPQPQRELASKNLKYSGGGGW